MRGGGFEGICCGSWGKGELKVGKGDSGREEGGKKSIFVTPVTSESRTHVHIFTPSPLKQTPQSCECCARSQVYFEVS